MRARAGAAAARRAAQDDLEAGQRVPLPGSPSGGEVLRTPQVPRRKGRRVKTPGTPSAGKRVKQRLTDVEEPALAAAQAVPKERLVANLNAWEEVEVAPGELGGGTPVASGEVVGGRAALKAVVFGSSGAKPKATLPCALRRSAKKGRGYPYPRPGLRSAKARDMPGRDLSAGGRDAAAWQ